MIKARLKVSNLEFPTVYGDWREITKKEIDLLENQLASAVFGEALLFTRVKGNPTFFGVELLKNAIVTLELEEDGEDK